MMLSGCKVSETCVSKNAFPPKSLSKGCLKSYCLATLMMCLFFHSTRLFCVKYPHKNSYE